MRARAAVGTGILCIGCTLVMGALVTLGLAVPASAAEPTAAIHAFSANLIPETAGTCQGCGSGVDLDLEYVFEGEGYGATPQNPKGGLPPLSIINLYLPEGTLVHPGSFGQCTEATLRNLGPAGCPASSAASPMANVLGEVTFGTERVPEETELRAFFGEGGPLFSINGHNPVSLEIVSNSRFTPSNQPPYGEELETLLPPVATVPDAPFASVKTFHVKLGAMSYVGTEAIPYLTLPSRCPSPVVPIKTEVTFGGEFGGSREFGIPAKTVTATFNANCVEPPPTPPTPQPAPTVVTGEYLPMQPHPLRGTVNPNGVAVTACYFEYGFTTQYGSVAPCAALPGSGTAPVEVSGSPSGLITYAAYHFRLVATNVAGTRYGSDQIFIAPPQTGTASPAPVAWQLNPSGRRAKLGILLRAGGCTVSVRATMAGTAIIKWYYVPPGARLGRATKRKVLLVAYGSHVFAEAGIAQLRIRLTRAGKALLRHASRIKLTAKGTFTAGRKLLAATTKSFTLRR